MLKKLLTFWAYVRAPRTTFLALHPRAGIGLLGGLAIAAFLLGRVRAR